MENRFFSNDEIKLLSEMRLWRFVCPPHVLEIPPEDDSSHTDWMQNHSHHHQYREILFVLDGCGLFGCGGKVFQTAPGTVFALDSVVEHDHFYPDSSARFEHLWFFIFPKRCIYQRVSRQCIDGKSVDRVELLAHSDNFTEDLFVPSPNVRDSLLALQISTASLIFYLLQQGYATSEPEEEKSYQGMVIDAVCTHIQDTAGRGVSLDTLTRISGYSKFHLLRLFKSHTGLTVHEYINICRKKRAAELEERGLYKKQISSELGFSCQAAYSRWRKNLLEK